MLAAAAVLAMIDDSRNKMQNLCVLCTVYCVV